MKRREIYEEINKGVQRRMVINVVFVVVYTGGTTGEKEENLLALVGRYLRKRSIVRSIKGSE